MSKYQVIVGYIGTVFDGDDKETALIAYEDYVEISKTRERGKAYGEDVTLFEDGEPIKEYLGHLSAGEDDGLTQ